MKLLSFDIEISDIFELGECEDMEKYAPFHVAVAATSIHNGKEQVWYSDSGKGCPDLNLTKQRAHELLEYLDDMQNSGFMVCAWNGLGFDLKWLGHHAGDISMAANIAMKSYDPMFQFYNQTGYPVGLSKVAEAMDIAQKKLMHGSDAPKQWQAGNYQAVMDYVLGDCQITNQVIYAVMERKEVKWVTSKGHISLQPMPRLKTVKEVIGEPEPDQSWMDHPIPKSKFCDWVR